MQASNPANKLTFIDRLNALKKMKDTIPTDNSIIQEDVSNEDKTKTRLFNNIDDVKECAAVTAAKSGETKFLELFLTTQFYGGIFESHNISKLKVEEKEVKDQEAGLNAKKE